MKKDTSWGGVAGWYDEMLRDAEGTYQKEVILPNLLRLMEIRTGEKIIDIACGQGFFSIEFAKAGAEVTGADISPELIAIAKKGAGAGRNLQFFPAPADKLTFAKPETFDKAAIILALQNIENLSGTLAEAARVLKKGGKLFLVMNHPAFRIPKKSAWGFDEAAKTQYRRIDEYLSESRSEIEMHPGEAAKSGAGKARAATTLSFHRPLQLYFKSLHKAGFSVTRLEEWISHKQSQKGPRQLSEDKARHEIPLFLFLEAQRLR